jgi:hypothetical protein
LFDKHASTRKSYDNETDGYAAVSLLGRGWGLSFFLAFLVLITIFVPMIRLSRPGRIALDMVFALSIRAGHPDRHDAASQVSSWED